jgi:hypothetical protein
VASPAKKNKTKQTANKKEVTALGAAIRSLAGLGGTALGSLVGMPGAGGTVGTSLGAALSRWLGAGDYTVSKNSLVQKAASSIPLMHNTGQTVVVRHKEFIATVKGTSDFTVQHTFDINPGLRATFPWLSGVASNFQEYSIKGLVFHYIPTSGNAVSSTNAALGSVMIQTSYRATEAAPASKIEILNEYWSNEVVPSETMVHPLECDPAENPFQVHYVRSASTPAGDTQLMYDLGRTFVATQGMQGTNDVGDIWVTYEVELKKPLISSSAIGSYLYLNNFTSTTAATMFQNPNANPTGNLALAFASSNTITFPVGTSGIFYVQVVPYSITYFGGSCSWHSAPSVTNAFLAPVTNFATDLYLDTSNSAFTNGTNISYTCAIRKTNPSLAAVLTIPLPTGLTGTWSGVNLAVYGYDF